MIHILHDYYILEKSDYKFFITDWGTKCIFYNSVLYADFSTCEVLSKNLSSVFSLLNTEDAELLKDYYSKSQSFSNIKIKCFVGYYLGFKYSNNIGFNTILKFWMQSRDENLTKETADSISICNESKSQLSFDTIPFDYFLPLVLKKIV